MSTRRFSVVILIGGLLVAGCGGTGAGGYEQYELGAGRQTVEAAIESVGGLDAWAKVSSVRTDAIFVLRTPDGESYVNRQNVSIDINTGRITSEARTGRGRWKASYKRGGKFSLRNSAALDRITAEQLRELMSLLLHRATGPFNLLEEQERITATEKVFIDGKDLIHAKVAGDTSMAAGYYFSAERGLLEMVTAGADAPGGDGTVTIYTYGNTSEQIVFPEKIEVFRIGEITLVGETPVTTIEFSNVEIQPLRGFRRLLSRMR